MPPRLILILDGSGFSQELNINMSARILRAGFWNFMDKNLIKKLSIILV
jgi:hypothetical protein